MRPETRYTPHVACDMRRILLALLVAGGIACADVDDMVGRGADTGAPDPIECVDPGFEPLAFRPADVLVLLDRSGSMDTAYGSSTRYQSVATRLSDLVATYSAHVRFGYQEMPGRQGCDGQLVSGCCASPPLVGIADDNALAVTAALASAQPMDGNTPTAASLQAALAYYETLADGIDNRFVLLATDGAPNCTLAGALSSNAVSNATAAGCADALSEVSAMVALGVRVIVLVVGPELADDASGDSACLDALAHAGGAAVSPGSPGFLVASDPQQLQMVIEQTFGGLTRPPCSVHFRDKPDDIANIDVFLDGKRIPKSLVDGWQIDSPTNPRGVIITGTYCQQIQTFQVTQVEAHYRCTPCVEGQECN